MQSTMRYVPLIAPLSNSLLARRMSFSIKEAGMNDATFADAACVPSTGDKLIITNDQTSDCYQLFRVLTGDQAGCVGDI